MKGRTPRFEEPVFLNGRQYKAFSRPQYTQ